MIDSCNISTQAESVPCDIIQPSKVKYYVAIKKGMAYKAFIKYIKENNIGKINKQIKKGTVTFFEP